IFFQHGQMGVLGFEPRTSALSELRSSQLSYTPVFWEQKKPNRIRFGSIPKRKLDRASPLLADVVNNPSHVHFTRLKVVRRFLQEKRPEQSNYRMGHYPVNRKKWPSPFF